MAGLEKFQANEAWRAQIKKLLFIQRIPTPPISEPQSPRFSLDLSEDLQVLLEEKAIPRKEKHKQSVDIVKAKEPQSDMFEEKEANAKSSQKNFSAMGYCNETMYQTQQLGQWQRETDESFMALEKMCDKTASDPDSTLFQYIHSEDKSLIVEDVKKRSADGNSLKTSCKKELQDLPRLLHDLCVKELENESPLKGIDVTQLEDVEAPSKLWDTTIVAGSNLQTSPVKMVGLLRPSTIMEECAEDESSSYLIGCDLSSQMSFQSALKGSEASTSYYESAHEMNSSGACKTSHAKFNNVVEYPVDCKQNLELINLDKTLEASMQPVSSNVLNDERNNSAKKLEEEMLSTSPLDDSVAVIEILSDDEGDVVEVNEDLKQEIIINNSDSVERTQATDMCSDVFSKNRDELERSSIENDKCSLGNTVSGATQLDFVKLDKKEESLSITNDGTDTCDNDKENYGIFNESTDQSLHFNDTMEEVEYMMEKGMQYMAAAEKSNATYNNQSPHIKSINIAPPTLAVKPIQAKERTFTYSPKKKNEHFFSPPSRLRKPKPTAVITGTKAKTGFTTPSHISNSASQKTRTRFGMNIKPIPKLDLFKKPPTSIPTRLKEPQLVKQFPHIVSPVGAYMKNTATTPLMANLNQRSNHPDVHNATVFRELSQATRIRQPKFELTGNAGMKLSSLPKKAYISSKFRHIVDERTPVTIPGGNKIHKYLENAMLPTVVRHEGKMKISATEASRRTAAHKASIGNNTQRSNDSLANLSQMSGDISLYTMKDARKF